MINKDKYSNTEEELPNLLMSFYDLKIILDLETQKAPHGCRIFALYSLMNLLKDEESSNKLHEEREYGKSTLFNTKTQPSVTDMVDPSLVIFSQSNDIANEYKK